jgi:hypothetical protein
VVTEEGTKVLREAGQTYIGRAHVRSAERDSLALQQTLRRALATVNLRPAGLSVSSILCVRTLRDPLPGALALHGDALPSPSWQAALATALGHMARHAARPALDQPPAGADAVLFSDRGEMLACLASDWLAGAVGLRWWWRHLLRQGTTSAAVLIAWRDAPEAIPAALARLSRQQQADSFVATLAPAAASALLDALLYHFALAPLRDPLRLALQRTGLDGAPRAAAAGLAQVLAVAPWAALVPEAQAAALSLPAAMLLGVALTLQRAPTVIRSATFARAVVRWEQLVGAAEPASSAVAPPAPPPVGSPTTSRSESLRSPSMQTDTPQLVLPRSVALATPAGRPVPRRGAVRPSNRSRRAPTATPATANAGNGTRLVLDARASVALPRPQPATTAVGARRSEAVAAAHQAAPTLDHPHVTQWGGLFYLLNVALSLDLYGDFSRSAVQGLALSPWDFLALIGEQLVGHHLRADPVWRVLDELAGRSEGEPPGAGFHPPAAWRLPPSWLSPFAPDRTWGWVVAGQRLRVQHPAGFWVVDVPLHGDPRAQVDRETRRYAAARLRLRRLRPAPEEQLPPLDRWLGWMAAYTQARLRRALPAVTVRRVGRYVCGHRAEVVATATHVTVHLSLQQLPIEIRLAGLDRDPGWVAAAGRTVTFVFE